MSKTFLVRGDCHAEFSWLNSHAFQILDPSETAIIILGDVGLNLGQHRNVLLKERVNNYGFDIYCVRGNHEVAPYIMPDMRQVYDPQVEGNVWVEPQYPHLKYFNDYGIYYIKTKEKTYRTLVIGGAYSIDKEWRLENDWFWYPYEQLTKEQRDDCYRMIIENPDNHYDFVLTHTCPEWMQPTDKFLAGINQSKVDKTMEKWLTEVQSKITYGKWCAGHFHTDRIVDRHHILYYNIIDDLDRVAAFMNH